LSHVSHTAEVKSKTKLTVDHMIGISDCCLSTVCIVLSLPMQDVQGS